MAVRVIKGLEGLRELVGQRIGASDWYDVTQERVNAFADGTNDHQWIHCDPQRAATDSPYGTTIAHGFFTLSLSTALAAQTFVVDGVRMVLNYGCNRVRFPAPVKVGSRVRMLSDLVELKETKHGVQLVTRQTFEVENQDRPACVAETVIRLFF